MWFSCGFAFCEARQTFVFNSSDSKVIENKTELEQSEGNESAGVCVSMLGGLGAVVFFFFLFLSKYKRCADGSPWGLKKRNIYNTYSQLIQHTCM